jgi:AcrR family transcriptional regulator
MGRPKKHGDRTEDVLLAAAERIVEERGLDALSVRGLAGDAGTSTRAVYSLFGSKDGLVVALGARAFDLLGTGVAALPWTDDPAADLVRCGLSFRRFAIEHPSLFAIGVQRRLPSPELWPRFRTSARVALEILAERIARLADADRLGGRTVDAATFQFHALCEGLAMLEARGTRLEDGTEMERLWEEALNALISGFANPPGASPPRPQMDV